MDFKSKFDPEEKEPDYFLGCGITQDLETGKIQIDPSKYIRETIAKYDNAAVNPCNMTGAKPARCSAVKVAGGLLL